MISSDKKNQVVEIKTVILMYNKADNLEFSNLIDILQKQYITKEMANIMLKKIIFNLNEFNDEAKQTIKLLISHGAIFSQIEDGSGYTALMHACFKGFSELVCLILNESAPDEINKVNKQNRNCLFFSILSPEAKNNLDMIHLLLKNHVNVNLRENLFGDSCLSISVKNCFHQITALLLQYGADPNIKLGSTKNTLLHICSSYLYKDLMNLLLINKADPFIKNDLNQTPLDILEGILKAEDILEEAKTICTSMHDNLVKIMKIESLNQDLDILIKSSKPIAENDLCIRKVRSELTDLGKKSQENDREREKDIQSKSFTNNTMTNEISPIIQLSDSKRKEKLNLPIVITPNKEILIDLNRDISITIDLNSTMTTEIDSLKIENKSLMHQSQIQHNTIIEQHTNSQKLAEMVDVLKNDVAILLEGKKTFEDKLSIIYRQLHEKEEKVISAEIKLNEIAKSNIALMEYKDKLEFEIVERNKEILSLKKTSALDNIIQDRRIYLQFKFGSSKIDDLGIMQSLHVDLLDFLDYNREQIKNNRIVIEKVVEKIRSLVSSFFIDLEVNIFGSYSTNLCLAWSDIDLVITSVNDTLPDITMLRKLCGLIQMQTWKKSCLLIEHTSVPLIKIVANENYLNYQVDISIQDSKHLGLKCVELVKIFLKEYEVLEPMIISLKNLLKCAGLNDPYKGGLSSYGLILLIVSFIQTQQDQGKPITKDGYNLGRLFMEFLYYYGVHFDPTKYIVYSYIPNEIKDQDYQVSL
jgi:ankyrin repeat protein/predicted nucleotidyltransferase